MRIIRLKLSKIFAKNDHKFHFWLTFSDFSEISGIATCNSDIFVLFDGTGGLRKFSLFSRQKCVEKLEAKGLHAQVGFETLIYLIFQLVIWFVHFHTLYFIVQAAQVIIYFVEVEKYSSELLLKVFDGLSAMGKRVILKIFLFL